MSTNSGYPPEVAERERALLEARRRGAGLDAPGPEGEWVGVGLSGGGIRSATFCLGAFQALARLGLLRRIDFLSSVSGGGYFAGFLGALWRRPFVAEGAWEHEAEVCEQVEHILAGEREPQVIDHLRQNGRYLSPNGAGDLLLGGAVLLRNFVAVHVVLASLALVVLLGAQLLWPAAWPGRVDLGLLQRGAFWWSPWALVPPLAFAVLALPPGWAYWLVGRHRGVHPATLVGVVLAGGLWLALAEGPLRAAVRVGPVAGWAAVVVVALTVATWAFVKWSVRGLRGSDAALTQRNLLSRLLKRGLVVVGLTAAFALVDGLGLSLYRWIQSEEGLMGWLGSLGGALVLVAGFGRRLVVLFGRPGEERPGLPTSILASVAAALLAGGWLVALDALAQAFVWDFAPPGPGVPALVPALAIAFGFTAVVAFLQGRAAAFLNQSTHQPLYSARLTRAYLGASNPQRTPGTPLWRVLSDDDSSLRDYWGPEAATLGAPLHVVNVTVNETVDGASQIQQQDRKGCPLALGPAGFSLGVRHHLLLDWTEPPTVTTTVPGPDSGAYRVFNQPPGRFRGEKLTLGSWIGISGAAFSTGTGYRTSLGLSLLAGLANIRLGRWWDPGNGPREGSARWLERFLFHLFPVHAYLVSELVARFPGTARSRWYLSDGGHFENLGGYELIRRGLRRIVLFDAEADPDYTFGGLSDLVRKARVDFGAEIRFLSEAELDDLVDPEVRDVFGTLPQLRRGHWRREPGTDGVGTDEPVLMHRPDRQRLSRAHATLAEIRYADGTRGRILYVKPTLCGLEPLDVAEYHSEHPDFPHESTADQFFDEAQWESYRRLGEHIATRLFAAGPDGTTGWAPRHLLL
ncbi:MAG: hypothetical protein R2991_07760 [Thermoanaerobaculia bacterium]